MDSVVTVLYFAELQDYANCASEQIRLAGMNTPLELFHLLRSRYNWPLIESDVRFAVNHRFVSASNPLKAGDSVAFIPPVSGG